MVDLMRTMTEMSPRHAPGRPVHSVRPPAGGARHLARTRPGPGRLLVPPPAVNPDPVVIRRRPGRPLVGSRERVVVLVLIAACALSVHLGARLAEGIEGVMSFGDTPAAGVAGDVPGS